MDEYKFEKWQDFNNLSLKVTINKKTYDSILRIDNNRLILKINMTSNIDEWRKIDKDYDIIEGKFLFDNQKIFFINCMHNGCSSIMNCTNQSIEDATVSFIIDRLILDKNITKTSLNKILKYSASFENLNMFSEFKSLKSNLGKIDYNVNTHNYKIKTSSYSMDILFYSSTKETQNTLSISRKSKVKFQQLHSININKALKNIYLFKNFLMIVLKQPIYVKKQEIYINDKAVELFDCNDNFTISENTDLKERLAHRCLKIENIPNIESIYNNFIKEYSELYPLIELYYNVTQFKIPNLTRFINATTMLEYFSRNYDFCNALNLSKNVKSKCTDPYYKDMVKSLINNVNTIYNYTTNEIDTISENIKSARIHYIHYKTQQKSKPLTYNEQFWYSYFIQDIVLLNIYKLLGLDISKYEYISYNDFYYKKNNLL